jgi:serine/threonine protein kinase
MNASQTIHPTDQTLHAYGAGKLENASAESVGTHLESCFDCRRRLALLSPDRFLARHRGAQGKPDSRGPIISSTDGLSMLAAEAAGSPAPPPASTLPPGLADHPNYVVTRELGRGGMGVVYLAQNTLLGRTEVLKVVGSHLISRRGVGDRFLAEVRNAAMLNHPNIVTAYSALRIGESLVLAMEHVDGLDLAKMVEARGPLPVAHACNYAHQAALGLQHAHEHGMVHRDIKPSNLMLARQNDRALIKVLDFGLAKVRSEGAVDAGLTHEGQMLGTPAYIAPEQISDARRADIRADIYSLGCTLYCLLAGAPPFGGTSLYDILQAHHSMEATPLNLKRPEVPVELAALVAKMMAKEPKRRFQEPKEVAQALVPFFKKGNLAFQNTDAEMSHAGQSISGPRVPGVHSTPTQPETNNSRPTAQEQRRAEPSAGEIAGEVPVDLREPKRNGNEMPAIAPARRPARLWPSAVVGVLVFGLFVAWAGILRVKTSNETIELAHLPRLAVNEPTVMPATIAGPELVAFYDFNDGTATDSSGRGNHGTLSSNPPSFTSQGYQGGALSFGAQQKNLVTIPVDINPSVMPQITMGGWFNSNSANVTQPLLSHDDNGFDRTLTVDKRGGGFGWKAFTGSGVFGGAPVVPGQWTFVAMRQDNLTGNLTLDVDARREITKSFFGLGLPRVRIGGGPAQNVWFD